MVGVGYVGALIDGPAAASIAFLGTPLQSRLSGRNLTKKQKISEVYSFSRLNRTLDIRAEVKFVNPDEAKKLVTEEGYTILDIRDKTQYDRAHIKSCYHAPLFIENNDSDLGTIFRRTMHNNFAGLLYGLPFTKTNSDFVPVVQQQFPTDCKLLLVCQEGLRSGVAAKKLEAAGYQNLAYITSGLQSVEPGTFEKEGSKELQDAGKAGLVAIQGKISAVLGTVLVRTWQAPRLVLQDKLKCGTSSREHFRSPESSRNGGTLEIPTSTPQAWRKSRNGFAFLFITIFPDQAEKLLQMGSVVEPNSQ